MLEISLNNTRLHNQQKAGDTVSYTDSMLNFNIMPIGRKNYMKNYITS